MDYDWPGNIRELKSALEYAFVIAENGQITVDHLPLALSGSPPAAVFPKTAAGDDRMQRQALIEARCQTGGNQTQAAKRLGINRVTVWNRMRKCGIDLNEVVDVRGI